MKLYWQILLAVLIFIILILQENDSSVIVPSTRQPRIIYNIAHMCNSVRDVRTYLARGANSIETDVQFTKTGEPIITYHGFPCDCLRFCFSWAKLGIMMDLFNQLTTPDDAAYNSRLALIMFDLKLSSVPHGALVSAGEKFAEMLLHRLFKISREGISKSKAWIVLSVPTLESVQFFRGFREVFQTNDLAHLLERIGYDIYSNDNLEDIEDALARIGIGKNLWVGDGFTNCLPRFSWRLNTLMDTRSTLTKNIHVYTWTIDGWTELRKNLKKGVNAIVTNQPDRMNKILAEKELYRVVRLANNEDNPFTRRTPG